MSDINNPTKLPSIPSLEGVTDTATRSVLEAIKEILEVREGTRPKGQGLDRAVTYRDLFDAGIVSYIDNGNVVNNASPNNNLIAPMPTTTVTNVINPPITPVIDLTPPLSPTGLIATGAKFNVLLEWNEVATGYMEIFSSDVNSIGTAVSIGKSTGFVFADFINQTNVTKYYWIRQISKAGVAGDFNAFTGTAATTGQINSADIISLEGAKIIDATIFDAKIFSLNVNKLIAGTIASSESVTVGSGPNRVILDGLGNIRMGATGYAAGTGVWLGSSSGNPSFFVGSAAQWIKFNGTNVDIATPQFTLSSGSAFFSGALSAPSGTLGTISAGNITLGTNGYLRQGQTAWNTGNGFWLGDVGGVAKFSVGTPSLGFTWDGSTFNVNGQLIATGNVLNNAITDTASSYTAGDVTFYASHGEGFDSWDVLTSLTATTSVKSIIDFFGALKATSVSGFAASGSSYGFRVVRDGTVLVTYLFRGETDVDVVFPASYKYLETSIGSHNYQIQCTNYPIYTGAPRGSLSGFGIVVIGLKK